MSWFVPLMGGFCSVPLPSINRQARPVPELAHLNWTLRSSWTVVPNISPIGSTLHSEVLTVAFPLTPKIHYFDNFYC